MKKQYTMFPIDKKKYNYQPKLTLDGNTDGSSSNAWFVSIKIKCDNE
jgi:hypothetical protein